MTKENYIKMTQPFRDHPEMAKGVHIVNKICTIIMYISYPALLGYMLLQKDAEWMRIFLVPAISFLLLSIFRYLFNRPRPYEAFEIAPIIPKDTKGKSFPSRHVFSATIIAMTFLLASPWMWLGIIFLCITVALAIIRVISGVHYISDVLAGILFGVLSAVVGYLIL